ncbi:MAG: flippase-like domain-containing protein [candidate division Zixibacteria bacterium]|nr:flippase-like domain-containing protein [candidate division Zixibacteria bacterium]
MTESRPVQPQFSRNLKSTIKIVLGLAAIVFMSYYLIQNWNMLQDYQWHFNIWLLLLSIVILWIALLSTVYIYQLIFRELAGARLSLKQIFRIINITNIGRYLPGKLWSVVGLIVYTSEYGINKKQTTLAVITNEVAGKASGLILGLCYFFFSDSLKGYLPAMVILLIGCMIVIHPWVLDKIINTGLRLLKKETIEIKFGYWAILKFVLIFIISWLLHSLAFYALVNSMAPIGSVNLLKFATILPLCWVIGYVILLAPGGLGVREAMLVVMLGEFLPKEVALAIAIIQRIWFTVVEGFNVLLALAVSTKTDK